MICMEVAGMKRVLFKIVLPVFLLTVWMITCYPICCRAEKFDFFLYWILVGCLYGIRKMCVFLVPQNFGIAGSMGILVLKVLRIADIDTDDFANTFTVKTGDGSIFEIETRKIE